MAGYVFVNGVKVTKPGTGISADAEVEVRAPRTRYVSRGGLKLEGALEFFDLNVEGLTAVDVGASTGGFTDCLLQRGASKVYAIDVGYGQLAWKLRQDPRVIVMERRNIRYLDQDELGEKVDLATVDVSFISLKKVLPTVCGLVRPEGLILALVKPQFEVGREKVGKRGVVKDSRLHEEVLSALLEACTEIPCFSLGVTYSPVLGPEGNVEFWLLLSPTGDPAVHRRVASKLGSVVKEAQRHFFNARTR